MKLIFSVLTFAFFSISNPAWLTDLNKAESIAQDSHKSIVLSFSGSDWCIPCIRLHKQIFESDVFKKYAEDNLVLVNADFPRLKKNKLTDDQIKQNEILADKYNPQGTFPLTLLLDANGNVLKRWEGFSNESPDQFTKEINDMLHGGK